MAEGEGRARVRGFREIDPVRVTLRMFVAGALAGTMMGLMGRATPAQRIGAPLVVGSMFAFTGYGLCNFRFKCLAYREELLAEEQAAAQAAAAQAAAARHD